MTKINMQNKMKLDELREILEAEVLTGEELLSKEVNMICGSDLMSDVLAFIHADSVLLTGLVNPQVVRTAEMAEISCICFVRGKRPPKETIELAEEKKIPLMATMLSMYESCGRLYVKGLPGTYDSK
jgi:predicted transcriptional regulator